MNNIGVFIAQLRKEQNMTQKELADKLGVTDKAVSKWERGKGIPDVDSIERLSNVLGVSVSELFNAKRDEIPHNVKIPLSRNKVLYFVANIIFLCVCSASIIIGCYMLFVQKIPLSFQMTGSADGPTAMFVQTKPSMKIAGVLIGAGVGLIVARILCLYKYKNKK